MCVLAYILINKACLKVPHSRYKYLFIVQSISSYFFINIHAKIYHSVHTHMHISHIYTHIAHIYTACRTATRAKQRHEQHTTYTNRYSTANTPHIDSNHSYNNNSNTSGHISIDIERERDTESVDCVDRLCKCEYWRFQGKHIRVRIWRCMRFSGRSQSASLMRKLHA